MADRSRRRGWRGLNPTFLVFFLYHFLLTSLRSCHLISYAFLATVSLLLCLLCLPYAEISYMSSLCACILSHAFWLSLLSLVSNLAECK